MMKQLPMFPVYQTADGSQYRTLHEAARALKTVRANPGHTLIRRPAEKQNMERYAQRAKRIIDGTYDRSTLLQDVRAVMQPMPAELTKLLPKQSGKQHVDDVDKHTDKLLATLIKHVRRSWNPHARHVVMHSSGYDTRLITSVLKHVAMEEGNNWLGEVTFVCFQPEIKHARAVFDYLGWPKSTWFPVDAGKPAVDYYAPCLDFKTIGANVSESERFWGGPLLTQLRLGGYLTDTAKPLQILSALFSDETCKWNRLKWGSVAWFVGCFLFDNPGIMPGVPQVEAILPFVNAEWLQLMSTFYLPRSIDDSKLALLQRLDPALADTKRFPNWRFSAKAIRERNVAAEAARCGLAPENIHNHIDQQKISQATAQKMEADYAASWYAQKVGPKKLDYQHRSYFVYWCDRNTHYMKAAFYQHLIDQGVNVTL